LTTSMDTLTTPLLLVTIATNSRKASVSIGAAGCYIGKAGVLVFWGVAPCGSCGGRRFGGGRVASVVGVAGVGGLGVALGVVGGRRADAERYPASGILNTRRRNVSERRPLSQTSCFLVFTIPDDEHSR
jgi:hypothetical protein